MKPSTGLELEVWTFRLKDLWISFRAGVEVSGSGVYGLVFRVYRVEGLGVRFRC